MICAGYLHGGKDSCYGDSGGPLMVLSDESPVIYGSVSFGHGCAQPNAPSRCSRIAKAAWLEAAYLSLQRQ